MGCESRYVHLLSLLVTKPVVRVYKYFLDRYVWTELDQTWVLSTAFFCILVSISKQYRNHVQNLRVISAKNFKPAFFWLKLFKRSVSQDNEY